MAAPILFFGWVLHRTGEGIESADALVALAALLLAEAGAAFAIVRLWMRPRPGEAAILWLTASAAFLEILFFFWAAAAFALRMPMTPA